MKENKISIVIDKPIEQVFEFTTNPKNTHLWIESIKEEVSSEYQPKLGTVYKNRNNDSWDSYKVVEFKENEIFTLSDLSANYHVRYSYRKLEDDKTELEYFEWMKEGELKNPFSIDVLKKLKFVMEN